MYLEVKLKSKEPEISVILFRFRQFWVYLIKFEIWTEIFNISDDIDSTKNARPHFEYPRTMRIC